MSDQKQALNPADIITLIGEPFPHQKVFQLEDFSLPSTADAEEYFPILINKTLQKPERFSLFTIPINELYMKVDEHNTLVAIFIKLDNEDLVKKMEKAIGDEYMASGTGFSDEPITESHFLWDYKNGCVSLTLNAKNCSFNQELSVMMAWSPFIIVKCFHTSKCLMKPDNSHRASRAKNFPRITSCTGTPLILLSNHEIISK